MTGREQVLVDACFALVLMMRDPKLKLKFDTQQDAADWVRAQLRALGIDVSEAVGASWGLAQGLRL